MLLGALIIRQRKAWLCLFWWWRRGPPHEEQSLFLPAGAKEPSTNVRKARWRMQAPRTYGRRAVKRGTSTRNGKRTNLGLRYMEEDGFWVVRL